jgi:hypothetical protein
MRSLTCLVVVAAVFALVGFGLATVQAAEQGAAPSQDQWRYTFHNGEWWYWMPAGKWVYYRNDQWNDYDPKTFTSNNSGAVAVDGISSSSASRSTPDSDTRPFYGRVVGAPERRPLETNGEVGPFYGRVLPNEFFGPARGRRSAGPFYGRGGN